ncbi:unnamed protein product, partial [Macrosiphum euphorbiae]
SYKITAESTFLKKTMNCLKAVILLWTGIIAFNASVTAYEIDGRDLRVFTVKYCGGVLKSIEVYYMDIRNAQPLLNRFDYFRVTGNIGPIRRLVIPYNQSPCDGEIQEIELPVKLLKSTAKQLKLTPSQNLMSRK